MKILFCLLLANSLLISAVMAQSPVTITIDAHSSGQTIPDDFCGLSFGAIAELPQRGGTLLFSPTNSQLITLFTNSGIRHLRLGGSTVEGLKAAHPTFTSIDNVFGFAKAADVKVIYSLPLLNGNAADDAAIAKYIWDHYRPRLDCFAIGNEPDIKRYHYPPFGSGTDPLITDYASYLAEWRKFADAVTDAVPDAKFAGPDAASAGRNGEGWAPRFVADEKNSGIVVLATQHFYVGGSPFLDKGDNSEDGKSNGKTIPAAEAIDKMLSSNWVSREYPSLYHETLLPVLDAGMPYRMTESNDYLKGVPNASDAFASALWGLDYLHWWAAHGACGVNFHNTEWLKTDTVYLDKISGNYCINPKAYAIRAFELGSHGWPDPVKIANGNKLNLTVYAVGNATNLCVTVINREHGVGARTASVTIAPNGFSAAQAEVMYLTASNGNAGARSGIKLGGSSIVNNAAWRGEWDPVNTTKKGKCTVIIPPTSAMIVKLSAD